MKLLFLPLDLNAGDVIRDKFGLLPGEFLVTKKAIHADGGFIWTIARTDGSPIVVENGTPIWQAETRFACLWALKRMGMPRCWKERKVEMSQEAEPVQQEAR